MAVFTAVAATISSVLAVGTAYAQGEAAEADERYKAAVNRNNAIIYDRKVADAKRIGKIEGEKQRVATRKNIGTQRALLAASGQDVGDGSAALLVEDTAAVGELDALTIENNYLRQAYGYEVEATNLRSNAKYRDFRAHNAKAQGRADTFGSLLTLGTVVADNWF